MATENKNKERESAQSLFLLLSLVKTREQDWNMASCGENYNGWTICLEYAFLIKKIMKIQVHKEPLYC